jgi:hypothetical protein
VNEACRRVPRSNVDDSNDSCSAGRRTYEKARCTRCAGEGTCATLTVQESRRDDGTSSDTNAPNNSRNDEGNARIVARGEHRRSTTTGTLTASPVGARRERRFYECVFSTQLEPRMNPSGGGVNEALQRSGSEALQAASVGRRMRTRVPSGAERSGVNLPPRGFHARTRCDSNDSCSAGRRTYAKWSAAE